MGVSGMIYSTDSLSINTSRVIYISVYTRATTGKFVHVYSTVVRIDAMLRYIHTIVNCKQGCVISTCQMCVSMLIRD